MILEGDPKSFLLVRRVRAPNDDDVTIYELDCEVTETDDYLIFYKPRSAKLQNSDDLFKPRNTPSLNATSISKRAFNILEANGDIRNIVR